jgi:DNA-binding winged helix-turn-helix (wHTH) protein
MKAAWADTIVEENNLTRHIFQLRKTLVENEQGQPFIETIPKRGYIASWAGSTARGRVRPRSLITRSTSLE